MNQHAIDRRVRRTERPTTTTSWGPIGSLLDSLSEHAEYVIDAIALDADADGGEGDDEDDDTDADVDDEDADDEDEG